MTTDEIVAYYGSARMACTELGLAPNAVSMWAARGHVPALAQIRIERATGGRLRYEPQSLPEHLRRLAPQSGGSRRAA